MAPLLFTIPGLGWEIQSYGFFMGLALVVAWVIAMGMARADKLPTDVAGTAFVVSVACGLLAARVAWLVMHPNDGFEFGSLVTLAPDGLSPFAGIATALVVSAVWVARRRVPVTAWFDVIAPAFAVGTILERVGALLGGTGYGRYAPQWPLAVSFPAGSPALADHTQHLAGLLPPGAQQSLPVHPTQLYGALLALVGLGLAMAIRKRRRFSGQVFLTYAIYLVVARLLVEEWFRADAVQPVLGPFNPGQVAGFAILAALGVILRTRMVRAARVDGGLRLWEGGRWSPTPAGSTASTASRSGAAAPKQKKAHKSKKRRAKGKRRG